MSTFDCEFFGVKHKLKFDHAVDQFLFGSLYFTCRNCDTKVVVDRPMFYKALLYKYTPGSGRRYGS